MAPKNHGFRKIHRVTLDRDFARAFSYRCSAGNAILVIYACPNGLKWSRLGIRVGGRCGSAVQRAYLRRQIREAFRTARDRIPPGYDLICVPRPIAKNRSADIAASFTALADKAVQRARNQRAQTATRIKTNE